MAKPTSTPRWSSASPGTTTVEPTSGKKDNGWAIDERPPAKYMNWLFYWIYQWIVWLTGAVADDAAGFTANQTLALSSHNAVTTFGTAPAYAESGWLAWTASGTVMIPIPLNIGDRIKSLTFARYGDGAADFNSIEVWVHHSDGTSAQIALTTSLLNPAASWATTTIDCTDTTLVAGDAVNFLITGSATGLRVGNLNVTYTHP